MSKPTTSWYSIRKRTATSAAARAASGGKGGGPSPQAQAASASAEIFIYGDIGPSWWEETITAGEFVKEINALDVAEITIRINSIGGSVPDGLAIYNAIKRHAATVTIAVDSVAYSIASLIAMAGDVVEMADNALMMIHAPWTYMAGNSAQMRDMADTLDTYARAMATSYADKTGRSVDEMLAWLTDGKDHYFTAAEAVAEKLADRTVSALPLAASARPLDLSRYLAHAKQTEQTTVITPAAAAAPTTEQSMPQTTNSPAAGTTQAAQQDADVQAASQAAATAERERVTGITAALSVYSSRPDIGQQIPALISACHAEGVSVQAAQVKVLDLIAKHTTPAAGGYVVTTEDEADKHRVAARGALLIRAGIQKNDGANPFRGYTLFEMARASLEQVGHKTAGLDKMALVAAAFTHSTSDFTNLLANVAEKSMMKGYETAAETFQAWTSKGSLPDFKSAKRVDLGMFPSLQKVAEGGEYKYVSLTDTGESVLLATYGNLFSITRQAIINDDLNAFSKIPRLFGQAAIRTVGDLVYAILTGNPNMADSVALFHSTHANLAGSGSVISTTSVDDARVAMATQKAPGQTTGSLNIGLKYLLVPVSKQGTALVVRNSEFEVGATTKNNTTPNIVRGTFEVVADARLDAASATAWYAAGDPNVNDTVEVSYLDGNETPTLEQQGGWSIDGVDFKVRMDAGAKAIGFRALYKNPGA